MAQTTNRNLDELTLNSWIAALALEGIEEHEIAAAIDELMVVKVWSEANLLAEIVERAKKRRAITAQAMLNSDEESGRIVCRLCNDDANGWASIVHTDDIKMILMGNNTPPRPLGIPCKCTRGLKRATYEASTTTTDPKTKRVEREYKRDEEGQFERTAVLGERWWHIQYSPELKPETIREHLIHNLKNPDRCSRAERDRIAEKYNLELE